MPGLLSEGFLTAYSDQSPAVLVQRLHLLEVGREAYQTARGESMGLEYGRHLVI